MRWGVEGAVVRAGLALAAVCLSATGALAQKQMEGGWCGAHGSFTSGYDCPRCSSGGSPSGSGGGGGGYTGPSFEELEAQRRAREEALARAREEAERARLRKEIADLDAAMKTAREAARRVRADEEATRRARRERRRAQELADEVLKDVFGAARDPGPSEEDPLFSKGTRDSAPVDSRSRGILAGSSKPLEFLGVPGGPAARRPAPEAAPPAQDRAACLAAMSALAARLGWSREEQDRLRAALEGLVIEGRPKPTREQVEAAWAAVHDPARAALAAHFGPAPAGSGTQTRHSDCTIFALASAAGVPYGVVAGRAAELVRQGAWRPAAERAAPQAAIERDGLAGEEVIFLAEALGQAEVIGSRDFAATLERGRPLLVCVFHPDGGVDAGHQVVLTRTVRHEGATWFEMLDSNEGPVRRVYVREDELRTILVENGVAFRPEPETVVRPAGGGLDFQRPR